MKFPSSIRKGTNWLWQRKLLIVFIAVSGGLLLSRPWLWPDGYGFEKGESETVTIESVGKDAQGNPTKITRTIQNEPGKTLWDWLSLLGVPLSLALLAWWVQVGQQKRAEVVAREQQKQVEDEAKEEALQVYLDRISVLLVDKNLLAIAEKVHRSEAEGKSSPKATATIAEQELLDTAVDVIRARTLSILRRFGDDGDRKTSVIRFLLETEIISRLKLVLDNANLSNVDLSGVSLSGIDLVGANLSGTDLRNADLSGANLSRINLMGANADGVNLSNVDLSNANLSSADFIGANLSNVDLSNADLSGANLRSANLSNAKLYEADLSRARLRYTNLSGTNLRYANLSGTNLRNANLSNANLSGANLRHTTLVGANLSSADFSSASLYGTKLNEADFSGVKFDDHTTWFLSEKPANVKNVSDELKKKFGLP
ncbi:MAG TPA: pentapeptide repeat-containing protein [Leptolyngbyaceae cyanobacterium]